MRLKFKLETLEGVDQNLAALYEQGADGHYYLAVDGAVDKSKLDEFRSNNVNLMKQLDQFKNVDPVKYQELLNLAKKTEEKKLIDAGEIDKIVESRVNEMKTNYETEIKKLSDQSSIAQRQLESLLIDNSVRDAALKSGVQPTAVEDVILRAKTTFKLQNGSAVPVDSQGNVIYGKDGSTPMSVVDWTTGLKKQAPHLFMESQGGGAKGSSKSNVDMSKLPSTSKIAMGLGDM